MVSATARPGWIWSGDAVQASLVDFQRVPVSGLGAFVHAVPVAASYSTGGTCPITHTAGCTSPPTQRPRTQDHRSRATAPFVGRLMVKNARHHPYRTVPLITATHTRSMYDETSDDGRYTDAQIAKEFGVTRPALYRPPPRTTLYRVALRYTLRCDRELPT